MSLWWRGKQFGRWQPERDADFWNEMTIERLKKLREVVREAFKNAGSAEDRIGFVPRTFALWALEKAGVDAKLGTGADHLIRSTALYQTIQVADGSWEDGPGKWKTLPPIYDKER